MDTYNYIILCSQRSGSHFLATLLNSHPDIACYGESGEKMTELVNATGRVKGYILMYNRVKDFSLLDNIKIIHLVRNSYDTARSRWVNSQKKFPSHLTEDVEFSVKIHVREVIKLANEIEKLHNKFRELIKNKPHIEVSYDDLTGGRSKNTISKPNTKLLLDFLGVEYSKLSTELKKPKWTFK